MSDPTNLEQPEEIRGPDGRRQDGRPTGEQPMTELRPGTAAQDAPTESPEEDGGEPGTEHAPGGDL